MISLPISDSQTIKKCIPQREPIIMVDALLAYKEHYVKVALTISAQNIFVQNQVLTEGGIVEHMAQSVALYTGFSYLISQKPAPTGYIGSISKLEIFTLPAVNQQLITEVEILHDILGVTLVNTTCRCNNQLVAQSQMKTVLAK
ncbi:hypothetical protein K5I29_10960 [Flavobacterium agricola]|uniref:3-hydroxymyristoyl/3-hydroxydecanoyl-(Acyl carrier protein) dehydratase n=1 Tax=Flavobacterium agricola TaxID=2870839 RepID=A0ABY6M1A2_9FLAO|nr:hypothetical protein [Flavobacterium agricola]UYW01003.1 hypothetical protein K5I29_10960 [Flavobacterium agricola]